MKSMKYNSSNQFVLNPCLYNEDATYLQEVTYLCFILLENIFFLFSAHDQKCFRENLLNKNYLLKHTSFSSLSSCLLSVVKLTVTGVTTAANKIYYVQLHVCRKPYNVNCDVL